jgi:hypothetical protein
VNWLLHWLTVHTGSSNSPGGPPNYNFWSGFGSDIGEIAIIGGLITVVRRHNCEVRGCWRLGRHRTAAAHQVCRRHHPGGHLTSQAVLDAHTAATAADGPVRGGAGPDPAEAGLPAETAAAPGAAGPVVPPPAATRKRAPKRMLHQASLENGGVSVNPVWIAALTGVAVAAATAAGWLARLLWRTLSGTTRFLDAFFGAEGRPGVMARLATLEESVAHLVRETRPDHGHSLRDLAARTARDVAEIKDEQARIRTQIELRNPPGKR